ncbi:MAG: STAS domain-containing protein [Actinobacteria bacterium]|nr:STAS domain-containing protein [Actinomycetota bacterium]
MALAPFKIEIEREPCPEGLRLKIGARVDASTVEEFEAALREAEATDAEAILIDLSGVVFMNYKGLAPLYEAHKRWRDRGERVRVVACSDQVRNLFALSGVYDRFMGHTSST